MPREITYGEIKEGLLKGRKTIVSPREKLPENLYLVEKGIFYNGQPMFSLYCLTKGCEKEIPSGLGCPKCNSDNYPVGASLEPPPVVTS